MVRSPNSRGKGNRQWPGRPGGRRKKRRPKWRNRAQHALENPSALLNPASLNYSGVFAQTAAHNAYVLDQAFAANHIPYTIQYDGRRFNFDRFVVTVSTSDTDRAATIISSIQRR